MRLTLSLLMCLCTCGAYSQPRAPRAGEYFLTPMGVHEVKVEDAFWSARLETHIHSTIPHVLGKLENTIENMRRSANKLKGRGGPDPAGISNGLSLVRALEGVGYCLMIEPNPELERKVDAIVSTIEEIYESERFYAFPEAAVAYYLATGKDRWMKVSEKDSIYNKRQFFNAAGKPLQEPPPHGGIEMGLCRLYQGTGKQIYLELAKSFMDSRGMPATGKRLWPKFAPQHKPIAQLNEPGGHAGSAGWFHSSLVDVGAFTGERAYGDAARRIWRNMVDTRICIHGGVGANSRIEGFGAPYAITNGGYNETCAASGNVFFNHRLFLSTGDAQYFDLMEVILMNGLLSGVSLSGDKFFYVNPLAADGIRKFNHGTPGRWHWWKVTCCPGSISRTIPQVPGYMYAHTDRDIYVTLYAGNRVEVPLASGKVGIRQETLYPFDGRIKLTLNPAVAGQEFKLRLRIPTWARERFMPGELYSFVEPPAKWTVRVNGKAVEPDLEKGFAVLTGPWKAGDEIQLDLPMSVQFSTGTEKLLATLSRVAVTRGPLLYCAEEVDNGVSAQRLAIPTIPGREQVKVTKVKDGVLAGMEMIGFPGSQRDDGKDVRAMDIRLVPYHSWNNRGDKSMTVWIPQGPYKTGKPLEWITSNDAKSAPRSQAGPETAVVFENKTGHRVKVYWVSYKGGLQAYGEIAPGGTRRQGTYALNTWVITDGNEKALGYFITGAREARAVIPAGK